MALGKVVETEQRPHLEVAALRLEAEQSVVLHEFASGTFHRHAAAVGELGVPLVPSPIKHIIARMVF